MKPLNFLPPAIALVIAGLWVGSQRRSIAILDEQNERLEKHIAAAKATGGTEDSAQGKSGTAGDTTPRKTPIDWKQAASLFAEMRRGGTGDNRAMIRLHLQLMDLTPDELSAALAEIQTLGLPEEARMMLESAIIGQLVEKAPEMALKSFFDRRNEQQSMMGWQLSHALAAWAKKDATSAMAWFDQQIAAGAFDSKSLDGKNRIRTQFEGALLGALLSADPTAVAHRLADLPQDQRNNTLGQLSYGDLEEKDQPAFAKLVREQLPEKDQAKAIARAVSVSPVVGPNNYSKVSDYLNRIEASPAECVACIDTAADSSFRMISDQRKITAEDVEKLRTWIRSEAPEETDRATGKALASVMNWGGNQMKFSDLADLAEQYHQAGSGDEVLIPLLESWGARQNKEQARKLAERISDEKRRNEFLKKLN